MSGMHEQSCLICDTIFQFEDYGDGKCPKCGQVYEYDEGYAGGMQLTDRQLQLLRSETGTCETCKHWKQMPSVGDKSIRGRCGISRADKDGLLPNGFFVECFDLQTGPEFGCIWHDSAQSIPQRKYDLESLMNGACELVDVIQAVIGKR